MTDLTNGDDVFDGTTGDDSVNGLGGNDIIRGKGGDDILNGGGDNDHLFGGANDDTLTGGSGDDILDGGNGDDTFTGGSGNNDTVVIHLDATNLTAAQNGTQLVVTTAEGIDTIVSGVEHIQFNNVTIDIFNGDALAALGADTASFDEQTGASGNILTNDIDIDDAMTLTNIFSDNTSTAGTLGVALAGQYGELTLYADGSYDYAAYGGTNSLAEGESVQDVYTYTVQSGGENSFQTITLTINGVNDTPGFTSLEDSATYNDTSGDDSFSNASGTLTASDVDASDTLTFGVSFGDTLGTADGSLGGYDTSVASDHGTLYVNSATGAYTFVGDDAAIDALKTTTHDVFTFTISDNHSGVGTQNFDVTLNGVNDRPELAAPSGITYTDTSADDTFSETKGALSGSDRDNDTLTYRAAGDVVDHAEHGYNRSVAGTYGTLFLNTNSGAYKYVPDDDAIQGLKAADTDVFTLRVNDGTVNSVTRTLTVTLNGANDTPELQESTGGNLVEAGGVANGDPGSDTSALDMTLSDRDTADTPTFDVTALTNNGWVVASSRPPVNGTSPIFYEKTGTYGTATLNINTGHVTYALDNDDTDTQALQDSDLVQDTFTVYATDGSLGNSTDFVFNIDGTNDAAVIAGTLSGNANEAGGVANGTPGTTATGTATNTDVDNDDNVFKVVTVGSTTNGYGNFAIDASGNWTYTIDNNDAAVQALNVGGMLSDSFTIFTDDFTSTVVNVTIHGVNDAAIVGGTITGSVTESAGPLSQGDPDTGGTLTDTDVDNDDNTFQSAAGDTDHNYGTYVLNTDGSWTFTVRNGKAEVQQLNDGDTLEETFTALTDDGTEQVVTVTINGQNEVQHGSGIDDIMSGTKWGDTMSGFGGNDIYKANNAADKVVEAFNEGQDLVRATVSYTLDANVEDLTLSGAGNLDGTGNGLDNVIAGNDSRNELSGLAGDDTLRGNGGNDLLIGGDNDDIINGGDGTDTVSYAGAGAGVTVSLATTSFQNTGGAGFDKITNAENLTGSGHADNLTGSGVKNVITGGGEGDTLTGGAGNDVFLYENASDSTDSAADTILDLTNGDKIDLSAIDSLFHVVGSFSGAGHELVFSYNSIDDLTTLAGDIDGDTVADLTILMTGDHTDFDNFI